LLIKIKGQQLSSCLSDDDLEKLIEEVVRASNRGVSAARNVSGEPNWSFGQSLFFSSTVVTTIGNYFVLSTAVIQNCQLKVTDSAKIALI
jgi:hypothetical protein